jgi:type IV secretory pathway VirB2 component (pilin)
MKKFCVLFVLLLIYTFLIVDQVEANTTTNLPWDSALKTLADSLTGPVAFSLGLFMIVCGFCAIAFVGAELGGWVRWVSMAAILAGMLGSAPTVLGLFGLKAAMLL